MTPGAPTVIIVRQRASTARGIIPATLRISLWLDARQGYLMDVARTCDCGTCGAVESLLDSHIRADDLRTMLRYCGERPALIRNAWRKVSGALLAHARTIFKPGTLHGGI